MRIKIFAGVGLASLVALVVAAVIVANPLSTQAAAGESASSSKTQITVSARAADIAAAQATQPDGAGQTQASPDTESKPYIGALVHELDDGSVKVVKALEGGPSDGVLKEGDVITSVNGEAVGAVGDLTDAIADAGSGASLTLSIMRDGSNMDVTIVVGDWLESERSKFGSALRFGRTYMGDRIASKQVVMADEDGNYRAHRTVFGNIANLDADAGTFTLQPKDGSAPIEYTVSADARVFVDGAQVDDLSSLNMDERTVVMDVDGEVEIVKQGEHVGLGGFKRSMGMMKGFGFGDRIHSRAFRDTDIQQIIDRLDVDIDDGLRLHRGGRGRFGVAWPGRDSDTISSLLEGIDDSVMSEYAPDGFEESLKLFLEDPESGGRIFVRRDGEGLNIYLRTDEGEMNFTIPAAALNGDDSF